ncbi:MAG TPA: choice-of-anchor tandem repeat GloVer-containing protein [Terriglobales bacterium]|nr:choice-of-anchor tandem repeat GloVer-containing protein [Terriglobales bacterium]
MRGKRLSIALRVTLAIFTVTLFVTSTHAATEKVLYSFNNNGKNGFDPQASLIFDQSGNLYGTTSVGGLYKQGTVFELMPKAGGGWTEKVLHNFGKGGDGTNPYAG